MQIVVSGIPVDIRKKDIKNMHLQVKPPEGHVVVSAPLAMEDRAIDICPGQLKLDTEADRKVPGTAQEHSAAVCERRDHVHLGEAVLSLICPGCQEEPLSDAGR